MFVISSNVQKLDRILSFKQNFGLWFKHVLMTNKFNNFYYRLSVDHSWKSTFKIIEFKEGGCNFVYVFSTFTDYSIICRVKN